MGSKILCITVHFIKTVKYGSALYTTIFKVDAQVLDIAIFNTFQRFKKLENYNIFGDQNYDHFEISENKS